MKEANNTPGENTKEMGPLEHLGDVSPGRGINNKVSYGASEILHIHKEFIQGDPRADVKMTEDRTGRDAGRTMRRTIWSGEENREMLLRIWTALTPNLTTEKYLQLQWT